MAKTNRFPFTYITGKIVPSAKATVPVGSKAVQYGLGCFSGIRGNWNGSELFLFRDEDHFKRLKESAKILGMTLKMTYPQFQKVLKDLLKKNKVKGDIYIRPTLYARTELLSPRFDNPDDDLSIYIISLKDYFDTSKGLNCCVSSWRRFDDDSISSKAKITGAYCNSALAKTEAIANGYDEPLFLNRDGKVCEASGANIFGIKDGVVYTPPLASNILNGITRRSVIELLKEEMGLEVREESIDRSTLYTFDEIFLCGTAAKIAFISSVDQRKIGTGKMGKVSKEIKELFEKASTGQHSNYLKWCNKY